MNEVFKIIKSNDSQIGVGKNPISSGALIVIEDNVTKTWISLTPNKVRQLIYNLNESINLK